MLGRRNVPPPPKHFVIPTGADYRECGDLRSGGTCCGDLFTSIQKHNLSFRPAAVAHPLLLISPASSTQGVPIFSEQGCEEAHLRFLFSLRKAFSLSLETALVEIPHSHPSQSTQKACPESGRRDGSPIVFLVLRKSRLERVYRPPIQLLGNAFFLSGSP